MKLKRIRGEMEMDMDIVMARRGRWLVLEGGRRVLYVLLCGKRGGGFGVLRGLLYLYFHGLHGMGKSVFIVHTYVLGRNKGMLILL